MDVVDPLDRSVFAQSVEFVDMGQSVPADVPVTVPDRVLIDGHDVTDRLLGCGNVYDNPQEMATIDFRLCHRQVQISLVFLPEFVRLGDKTLAVEVEDGVWLDVFGERDPVEDVHLCCGAVESLEAAGIRMSGKRVRFMVSRVVFRRREEGDR
jgi:hypothetical protein